MRGFFFFFRYFIGFKMKHYALCFLSFTCMLLQKFLNLRNGV